MGSGQIQPLSKKSDESDKFSIWVANGPQHLEISYHKCYKLPNNGPTCYNNYKFKLNRTERNLFWKDFKKTIFYKIHRDMRNSEKSGYENFLN